jgi:hypothetical protein
MVTKKIPTPLLIGDGLAILVVTWIGFLSHKESLLSPRWLTTLLPVAASWALVAPWLGNYRPDLTCNPRQSWWRAALAMLLAAPLAGFFRALMLDTLVVPIFVVVLGLISAVGMSVWRLAYALITRKEGNHG